MGVRVVVLTPKGGKREKVRKTGTCRLDFFDHGSRGESMLGMCPEPLLLCLACLVLPGLLDC